LEEFDAVVMAALPIADAIVWLRQAYPDVPLGTLLKLYGRMHSGRYAVPAFAENIEEYATSNAILAAYPMRLERSGGN
jgi:hypothetical protein